MLRNFINKSKSFFFSLNSIIKLKNIRPKFVFFSENKSYQKYSKLIIDVLCENYPGEVYYFSIDKEDTINDKRVKNIFIDNFLIKFFFNNVNAENMFLTLTDLGNHFIKKTPRVSKYVYYFHSPISTTKSYTPKAFDNYDIILCNGHFQVKEIRTRENLKNLNKKILIPTGYFFLDFLAENINHEQNSEDILIAPSWNYKLKNFINENFVELINILLNKNQKVIFRPHPEHYKRSKKILQKIKNKFLNKNFKFDDSSENLKSMEKSKCLITDTSGIAIEYIMTLKRPVLYLDEFDKIHNSEFKDYADLNTIDFKIKENFGYLFKKEDFNEIDKIINDSIKDIENKLPELDTFINENFANFGQTKKYFKNILKQNF